MQCNSLYYHNLYLALTLTGEKDVIMHTHYSIMFTKENSDSETVQSLGSV